MDARLLWMRVSENPALPAYFSKPWVPVPLGTHGYPWVPLGVRGSVSENPGAQPYFSKP